MTWKDSANYCSSHAFTESEPLCPNYSCWWIKVILSSKLPHTGTKVRTSPAQIEVVGSAIQVKIERDERSEYESRRKHRALINTWQVYPASRVLPPALLSSTCLLLCQLHGHAASQYRGISSSISCIRKWPWLPSVTPALPEAAFSNHTATPSWITYTHLWFLSSLKLKMDVKHRKLTEKNLILKKSFLIWGVFLADLCYGLSVLTWDIKQTSGRLSVFPVPWYCLQFPN